MENIWWQESQGNTWWSTETQDKLTQKCRHPSTPYSKMHTYLILSPLSLPMLKLPTRMLRRIKAWPLCSRSELAPLCLNNTDRDIVTMWSCLARQLVKEVTHPEMGNSESPPFSKSPLFHASPLCPQLIKNNSLQPVQRAFLSSVLPPSCSSISFKIRLEVFLRFLLYFYLGEPKNPSASNSCPPLLVKRLQRSELWTPSKELHSEKFSKETSSCLVH